MAGFASDKLSTNRFGLVHLPQANRARAIRQPCLPFTN